MRGHAALAALAGVMAGVFGLLHGIVLVSISNHPAQLPQGLMTPAVVVIMIGFSAWTATLLMRFSEADRYASKLEAKVLRSQESAGGRKAMTAAALIGVMFFSALFWYRSSSSGTSATTGQYGFPEPVERPRGFNDTAQAEITTNIKAPEIMTLIYAIGGLMNGATDVEAIKSRQLRCAEAIRAAILEADAQTVEWPKLKFSSDTQTLSINASARQHQVIDTVLQRLKKEANDAQGH